MCSLARSLPLEVLDRVSDKADFGGHPWELPTWLGTDGSLQVCVYVAAAGLSIMVLLRLQHFIIWTAPLVD